VVVIAALASLGDRDAYQAFRHRCLANPGDSLITLSTTVRNVTMGGPETGYTVGCRQPNGKITATVKTNHL
jgi:hypothetical protein